MRKSRLSRGSSNSAEVLKEHLTDIWSIKTWLHLHDYDGGAFLWAGLSSRAAVKYAPAALDQLHHDFVTDVLILHRIKTGRNTEKCKSEKEAPIGTAFWGNWSYFECSQQFWIHLAHLMILNSCAQRQSLNSTSNNRHTLVHTHTHEYGLYERV